MLLGPGRMLSHYRLVAKVGEGGVGVVWKARDEKLRRDVALKILPPALVADPDRRRRLVREARAAAAVTHPHIAAVHEIDEAAGILFVVMEYVEGDTLRLVLSKGRLSLKKALRMSEEMAEALACAHQAHIVHRDLKPENVLLRADGHSKILDFGLAKELRTEVQRSRLSRQTTLSRDLTREGGILGTTAYMSPEQARGDQVDPRSDLFSLGIVVCEMVTGRVPFQRDAVHDTVPEQAPVPASRLNSKVPSELDRILEKCLEKDPADRYQDSRDLVVDLRRLRRRLDSRPREGPISPGPEGPALSSDAVDQGRFLPGTMVGNRYRIVGLLGKGGMGEVYRADDLKLGQAVALKYLPEALADDPGRLAQLRSEVRIARQVSHPNVCRVYDIGEVDGQHFLSMEYGVCGRGGPGLVAAAHRAASEGQGGPDRPAALCGPRRGP